SHVKVGEEKHSLTPDPEQVHVTFDPVFTDNNTIYFITDYDSDDVYVAKFDLEKKSFSKIVSIEGESIDTMKWDKTNQALYLVTTKGVADVLYRYDLATEQLHELTMPPNIFKSTDAS